MKYETITIETLDSTQDHIIIDLGDGAFKSFPADENNPEYVAFLAAIEPVTETPAKTK